MSRLITHSILLAFALSATIAGPAGADDEDGSLSGIGAIGAMPGECTLTRISPFIDEHVPNPLNLSCTSATPAASATPTQPPSSAKPAPGGGATPPPTGNVTPPGQSAGPSPSASPVPGIGQTGPGEVGTLSMLPSTATR